MHSKEEEGEDEEEVQNSMPNSTVHSVEFALIITTLSLHICIYIVHVVLLLCSVVIVFTIITTIPTPGPFDLNDN